MIEVMVVMVAISLVGLWFSAYSLRETPIVGCTVVGLLTVLIGYICVSFEGVIRRNNRIRMSDYRALSNIVALLRETEGAIATQQKWSTLERTIPHPSVSV